MCSKTSVLSALSLKNDTIIPLKLSYDYQSFNQCHHSHTQLSTSSLKPFRTACQSKDTNLFQAREQNSTTDAELSRTLFRGFPDKWPCTVGFVLTVMLSTSEGFMRLNGMPLSGMARPERMRNSCMHLASCHIISSTGGTTQGSLIASTRRCPNRLRADERAIEALPECLFTNLLTSSAGASTSPLVGSTRLCQNDHRNHPCLQREPTNERRLSRSWKSPNRALPESQSI